MRSLESFDALRENARICEENIRALCKKNSVNRELILWLKELAAAEAALCARDPSRVPVLPQVLASSALAEEMPPPSLRDPVARMNAVFSGDVVALYAGFLCEALSALGEGWLARRYPAFKGTAESTFVYVRTPVADKAYRHFSSLVTDPKVYYASSFEEACGEVYGEHADYVLLPLFGADSEPVRKSLLLLEKYELNILFSVRLYAEGEELLCEFAMAGREPFFTAAESERALALVQYPGSEAEGFSFLSAIAFFGCRIRCLESGSAAYDRRLCRVILEGGNTEALLMWLQLSQPHCSLGGIYTVSEAQDG